MNRKRIIMILSFGVSLVFVIDFTLATYGIYAYEWSIPYLCFFAGSFIIFLINALFIGLETRRHEKSNQLLDEYFFIYDLECIKNWGRNKIDRN